MGSKRERRNKMSKKITYKGSQTTPQRTINFRFSVNSKSDRQYTELKSVIHKHNEVQKTIEANGGIPHYLRVRGRGRKPTVKGQTYSILDHTAQYFDVYVVRDTDAMKRYKDRTTPVKTSKVSGVVKRIKDALTA